MVCHCDGENEGGWHFKVCMACLIIDARGYERMKRRSSKVFTKSGYFIALYRCRCNLLRVRSVEKDPLDSSVSGFTFLIHSCNGDLLCGLVNVGLSGVWVELLGGRVWSRPDADRPWWSHVGLKSKMQGSSYLITLFFLIVRDGIIAIVLCSETCYCREFYQQGHLAGWRLISNATLYYCFFFFCLCVFFNCPCFLCWRFAVFSRAPLVLALDVDVL